MRRSIALAVFLGAGLCLAPLPGAAQEEVDEEAWAEPQAAPEVAEADHAWWARVSEDDDAWWSGTSSADDAWWTGAPAAAQSEAAGPSTDEPASLEEEEESSDPRRSCATLIKQIAHYEGVKGLAEHRGDELWQHGTELQLERLRARQRVQCPEDVPPNAGQRMAVFAAQAALLAYQLFMMGLL
jgi:hypothetical protein